MSQVRAAAGSTRPTRMSPDSIPAAVTASRQPAACLPSGTNSDSQPTTSPLGTQPARNSGRSSGEPSSARLTARERRTSDWLVTRGG